MIMSHFSQKAVSFYTLLMAKISTNHLKYGILTLLKYLTVWESMRS